MMTSDGYNPTTVHSDIFGKVRRSSIGRAAIVGCAAIAMLNAQIVFPGKGKRIVLVSGDEEYRSEESLPQLAKILSERHGFECTVLFAIDPADGTIRPDRTDNIPGLEALDSADLLILLTRFRDLPDGQMKHIVDYIESGKPVIGLRTATHAFQLNASKTYTRYDWRDKSTGGFGRLVLGETWINHHGNHDVQSTRGIIAPGEEGHPILRGIRSGDIWGPSDVYEVRLPLPGDSRPLVLGQVLKGMRPTDSPAEGRVNNPMMPVAWVRSYQGARVFTTTMGAAEDFLNEGVRRMVVNATYWALGLENNISPTADVRLVGEYHPSHFSFGGYVKGKRPSDLAGAPVGAGKRVFAARCAGCHGGDARGGGKAPGLAGNPRIRGQSEEQLRGVIQRGFPASGMPAFDLAANELNAVAGFVLSLNIGEKPTGAAQVKQVVWSAPKPGDWLTYNGKPSANRYSELKQIHTGNVAGLRLKWIFPINYFGLETTPLEAGGVMYVTGPNQVFAIDALTGSQLWKFARPQNKGLDGDAVLGTNRGVAIKDGKVFYVTDNAHLLALDRTSGSVLWETTMPESSPHYGGTLAPLVVKDMVIAGVSGADEGIRGFVASYKAETGELLWRHWTIPKKGEPGSETWEGAEPAAGGGSTWLTGSYDEPSDTLYWPTGNPFPDDEGPDRNGGDNLYSDCILALDPNTGEMKWHYQFTPHDVMDRDATEPHVLVDTIYRGKPRKLLLHADRNGFFYVLDRATGELLLAKPFLRRVDWATEIGKDGRPIVKDPSGCPSDAANWSSTAYSPVTRLYYFLALEECTGSPVGYPDQTGQRYLRALNIETGKVVWEDAQPGPARAKTWSGVLATAGGLIFYGQPNGGFDAVDERNGKTLWHFPTNVKMKASPMTFELAGKQYVAVAAGPNILCFGL